MKNNTYRNAVDHLAFSDDLYDRVLQNADVTGKGVRFARAVAIAAVITVLLATTALAVGTYVKDKLGKNETPVTVQTLGTDSDRFDDAQLMNFTISTDMEGVSVHYMELETGSGAWQSNFYYGYLCDAQGNYYRITDDYQLELVEPNTTNATLEKDGKTYLFMNGYSYVDAGDMVISKYHHGALRKNENGEILTHVYCADENLPTLYPGDKPWPVYLNVETGEIRDALGQFSPEDFPQQRCYAHKFKDGLLIDVGTADGFVQLWWIGEGAAEPVVIQIPEEGSWSIQNDTIYYSDKAGWLYCLDEDLQLQKASAYRTPANPSGGNQLVITDQNKLGIFELQSGNTYVFEQIDTHRGEIANRYYLRGSRAGRITLVKKGVDFDPCRPILEQIGILDLETQQLKLLQIDNGYTQIHCGWLDDDRFGVIYENEGRRYLCIYEFE